MNDFLRNEYVKSALQELLNNDPPSAAREIANKIRQLAKPLQEEDIHFQIEEIKLFGSVEKPHPSDVDLCVIFNDIPPSRATFLGQQLLNSLENEGITTGPGVKVKDRETNWNKFDVSAHVIFCTKPGLAQMKDKKLQGVILNGKSI